MNWRDVPLPSRMELLERDRRGLPVPFVIYRDPDGTPNFLVNDMARTLRCLLRKYCPICGERLTKELWFLGGPLSAFAEGGCYLDTAMHHECMTYALRVCPYLAVGRYTTLKDTVRAKPGGTLLIDPTVDPNRPECFVAVMAYGQHVSETRRVSPLRPYHGVEFWKEGEQLPFEQGIEIVSSLGLGQQAAAALRLLSGRGREDRHS